MSNYNEALESEKRTLSLMVETSFYLKNSASEIAPFVMETQNVDVLLKTILQEPELIRQIIQAAQQKAAYAQQDTI